MNPGQIAAARSSAQVRRYAPVVLPGLDRGFVPSFPVLWRGPVCMSSH